MACIDPGDVGPWGATKRHRGVPIPSPGSPGLQKQEGTLEGLLVTSAGRVRNQHMETAGPKQWVKLHIPPLNMKGWTFLQALPIPFPAITLWMPQSGRSEHLKGNPSKCLSVEKEHPPELPWIWWLCAHGTCCCSSCAWLTRCHPSVPQHSRCQGTERCYTRCEC